MNRSKLKIVRRTRRQAGIRKRIIGGPDCPRLTVFRSNHHIYAQVIDDLAGRTLVSASSRDKAQRLPAGGNVAAATAVGKVLAERAKAAGIREVVFDRRGYQYHGRVKALAEAVREEGVKF